MNIQCPGSRIQHPTPTPAWTSRFWGRQHTARCSGLLWLVRAAPRYNSCFTPVHVSYLRDETQYGIWGAEVNEWQVWKRGHCLQEVKGQTLQLKWPQRGGQLDACASESWPPNLTVHDSLTVAWNNRFSSWETWDLTQNISLGTCRKSSLFFMAMILKL